MLANSLQILKALQYSNGLFAAARKDVKTGYNRAWIRDNVYSVLGFEAVGNFEEVKKTLHALLDILKKHEYKIDWMIKQPLPKHSYRYIHARYDPITNEEIHEQWGNKQNDSIGALLFKIGDLERRGINIIRDEDKNIIQKLVDYLQAIEYWHDKDNGMWEENEEVHASSIGACVAGLKKIKDIVNVPQELIEKGEEALNNLLPRESLTKEVDLALLSLIYPYNIITEEQREQILENVEEQLLRERGVIRYKGDRYYYFNGEAEWTFGLAWLSIIYKQINNVTKQKFFLEKTLRCVNIFGELPELYFANTSKHNDNFPLAWAQSLMIVAMA